MMSSLGNQVKQDWKQLVLIGNGFDLECGLPSSFSNFIADRKKYFAENNSDHNSSFCYVDTVWDLILRYGDDHNWCDVEGMIADWIVPKKISAGITDSKAQTVLDCLNNWDYVGDKFFSGTDEETVARYIHENIGSESIEWDRKRLLEYLKKELNILENDFNNYLTRAVQVSADYEENARQLILEILVEERPKEHTINIEESILSFNYTNPIKELRSETHYIDYLNIHGRLGGEIVFGIDGKDLLSESDIVPFTKTYRLMALDHAKIKSVIKGSSATLKNSEMSLIKFYGHSLGAADYSYFQAIFDSVGLYEGNTRLIFYYRSYKDVDEEFAHKAMMDKTIRLLASYGETLDNRDHGKT